MNKASSLRGLLLLPRRERENPEVVATIREMIESNPDALRFYVSWMSFEVNLQWLIKDETGDHLEIISQIRRERRTKFLFGILTFTMGAAVFGIGVQLCAWILGNSVPEMNIADAAGFYESPTASVWADGRKKQSAVIREGERLQLLAGQFRIQMDSGATLSCIAPVDLEITNSSELYVHSGEVCVQVPKRAHGFRVNTDAVKIVDLGTLFGVYVDEFGKTSVHVLEGTVTGQTLGKPPLEIHAGFSRTAMIGEALSETSQASSEQFSTQLMTLAGIDELTGSVEFLLHPPKSISSQELVASSRAYVFQEQAGVELQDQIQLATPNPGRYDIRHPPDSAGLSDRTVADIFLIHASNSGTDPITGTVRFQKPIIGLALSAEELKNTDKRFGHLNTSYSMSNDDMSSRGAVSQENDDWIEISEDGKTLTFQIGHGQGTFDQIRVFVDGGNNQ